MICAYMDEPIHDGEEYYTINGETVCADHIEDYVDYNFWDEDEQTYIINGERLREDELLDFLEDFKDVYYEIELTDDRMDTWAEYRGER